MFPVLFVTDITTPNASSTAGDWQCGGDSTCMSSSANASAPIPPSAVFGTWKAAVRNVDQTKAPPAVTVQADGDPAKNNWNLAGGDPVPNVCTGPTGVPCNSNANCAPRQSCVSKICSGSTGLICATAADCAAGQTCVPPPSEGFGTECRWDVDTMISGGVLQTGHSYRLEFMVHDGDQNKVGGDTGENCVNITIPF